MSGGDEDLARVRASLEGNASDTVAGKRKRGEAVEVWSRKRSASGDTGRSLLVKLNLEAHPPISSRREARPSPARPKAHAPTPPTNAPASEDRCVVCGTRETPQWRRGPWGPRTLCNACGVKYAAGNLLIPGTRESDSRRKSTALTFEKGTESKALGKSRNPIRKVAAPRAHSRAAANMANRSAISTRAHGMSIKIPPPEVKGKAAVKGSRAATDGRGKVTTMKEQIDDIRLSSDEESSVDSDEDNDDPAFRKARLERQIRDLRRRLLVSEGINQQLEQCIRNLLGEDGVVDDCLAAVIRKSSRSLRRSKIAESKFKRQPGSTIPYGETLLGSFDDDASEAESASSDEEESSVIEDFCRAVRTRQPPAATPECSDSLIDLTWL